MVDSATSPHVKWVDYKVIPIDEYPDSCSSTDSTSTSWDQDAPMEAYYTSSFKADPSPEEPTCSYSPAPEKEIVPAIHGTEENTL